jgi:hypothetical protein
MSTLNPLEHPICFAQPVRQVTSAWIQHVPFGMFLIDLLRPRVVVELGAYNGVSYCAFCQAVKDLKVGARCYAVDTWQGDTQSGFYEDQILQDLREHHDPLYGGFSRLIQSTFDDALIHFADGSIDLLHIDGLHTYEAVKHDFETWLPKMSERGVMLFHDINVRERDFGVWKLWEEELRPAYPHYEMAHGHGLGLLAVGAQTPEPLQKLLQASPKDLIRIREFFYHLGVRLESVEEWKQLSRQQADTIRMLRDKEASLERLWSVRLEQTWSDGGIKRVFEKSLNKFRRKVSPPPGVGEPSLAEKN